MQDHPMCSREGEPDDQCVAFWYPNRVLIHQLVEFAGHQAEIEISHALHHAVSPNLFQGWDYGCCVSSRGEETLQVTPQLTALH